MQEDARARIYDEYDKRNKRGVYAECTDPDSDDFYRTPDEKAKLRDEKLKADNGGSALTRRREAVKRIYARPEEPAPEVAPDDNREPAHQAVDAFLEAHPQFTKEKEWQRLRKIALESQHDDLIALRAKAEKTGTRADFERLFNRAVDVDETERVRAARRAAFEKTRDARSPFDDSKINKAIQKEAR